MILPKTNCEPERNFPKQSKNRRNLIHHAKKSLSYLDSPLYKEVLLSKYCHIKSIQSNQRVNSQKSNIQVWEFFVILVVFVSFLKCVNCSPGGVAQSISALSREVLQGCRLNPCSGHIPESANECITTWNNKATSLSPPIKSINKKMCNLL